MRICLLTYDTPHRKTAQVFMDLMRRGIDADLMLMPFTKRPQREVLFDHRPAQFIGPEPQSLAAAFGCRLIPYDDWRGVVDGYDTFLVCGSNLIEPEFANTGKILNCHAGLIPSVRGLDSLKWAILQDQPLGNTLHRIDQHTDAGEVIAYRRTPVFKEDDLRTLADRHYEAEIWMLGNFDRLLSEPRPDLVPLREPTKRMPMAAEREMLRGFDAYKERHAA